MPQQAVNKVIIDLYIYIYIYTKYIQYSKSHMPQQAVNKVIIDLYIYIYIYIYIYTQNTFNTVNHTCNKRQLQTNNCIQPILNRVFGCKMLVWSTQLIQL